MPKIVSKPPGAEREACDRLFHITFKRNQPCLHLDFELAASRTVRQCISIVLSHTVVILCYYSPRKLTQGREGSGCSPSKFPKEVSLKQTLGVWEFSWDLGFPGSASGKEPACHCRRYETGVWSLGWENPLEEGTTTHSNILAWRIPWTEEPGGLQSMGSQSQTRLKWLSMHEVSQAEGTTWGIAQRQERAWSLEGTTRSQLAVVESEEEWLKWG